jgi:hypothetical protein
MYGIPYLQKKGIVFSKVLPVTKEVLDDTDKILDFVSPIIPQLQVVDKIIEFASVACGNAEQLYKSQQLSKEERKINAESAVNSMLKELGVEITPERQNIISIAIESAVNRLSSSNDKSVSTSSASNIVKDLNQESEIQGTTNQTIESVITEIPTPTNLFDSVTPVQNTTQPDQSANVIVTKTEGQTIVNEDTLTKIQDALKIIQSLKQ